MFRLGVSAGLVSAALLVVPEASAQAPAEFPCAELAATLTEDFRDEAGVFITAPEGGFVAKDNPFKVEEMPAVTGAPEGVPYGGPLIAEAPLANGGAARCLFMTAAFLQTINGATELEIEAGGSGGAAFLPILIVYRMDANSIPGGETLALPESHWRAQKYNVLFGFTDKAALSGERIALSAGNFRIPTHFHGEKVEQRVYRLADLRAAHTDKEWTARIRFQDKHVSDRLLVLCFAAPCEEFLGPGRDGDPGSVADAIEEPEEQDPEVSAISDAGRASDEGITAAKISALTRLDLESYDSSNKNWAPIIGSAKAAEKFRSDGGLPCLLHAMDSDLFRLGGGLTCDAALLDKLRERLKTSVIVFEPAPGDVPSVALALARIHPDKRNEVVEVTRLEVEVPADGSDRGCTLSAIYETGNADAPVPGIVELTRTETEGRVLHAADLSAGMRPVLRGGAVTVQISVAQNVGCRLNDRSETLRANGPTLTMQLTVEGIEFRNLVYLPLFNGAGLDAEFSTTADRRALADAMLMAIASAHRRLSVRIGDGDLQVRRAEVMLIEPGAFDIYASLDLVRLRNLSEVNETFHATDRRKLQSVAEKLLAPDPAEIARYLSERYGDDTFSRQIVLIDMGHWIARDRAGSLCDPLRLTTLQDVVARATGKTVRVISFPLIRVSPDEEAEVAGRLMPQSFVPSRDQAFREVVACRDNVAEVEIYPFLAPDWYGVEEMAYRYGAAVADHLGGILEDVAVVSRGDAK